MFSAIIQRGTALAFLFVFILLTATQLTGCAHLLNEGNGLEPQITKKPDGTVEYAVVKTRASGNDTKPPQAIIRATLRLPLLCETASGLCRGTKDSAENIKFYLPDDEKRRQQVFTDLLEKLKIQVRSTKGQVKDGTILVAISAQAGNDKAELNLPITVSNGHGHIENTASVAEKLARIAAVLQSDEFGKLEMTVKDLGFSADGPGSQSGIDAETIAIILQEKELATLTVVTDLNKWLSS